MSSSDLATRRLRVIRDAAWSLQHDYTPGALAMLLAELDRTTREDIAQVRQKHGVEPTTIHGRGRH